MKKIAMIITGSALMLAGCSKESSPEPKVDASVNVDTTKTKDQMSDALNKAGNKMKKAGSEAKEKLEDAGDALKKKAEEAKDKLSGDKKPSVDVEVKTK